MKTITFIGYMKEPLQYYDSDDLYIIESMKSLRSDNLLMVDWKDINPELYTKKAFNLRRSRFEEHTLLETDCAVFLEFPLRSEDHNSDLNIILDRMKKYVKSINPLSAFEQYPDKSYIVNLSHKIPFPKSKLITSESDIESLIKGFDDTVVVKPILGAGGSEVYKLDNDYSKVLEVLRPNNVYLLQNFVPEISSGEKSLFFFNKQFRYAILKKPIENEFKSNYAFCQSITRYHPEHSEIDIAYSIVDAMNCSSLIDRVDMAGNKVIEVTVECPGTFVENASVQSEIGKWFYEVIDKI